MRCCIDDFGATNARFPAFSAGFYSSFLRAVAEVASLSNFENLDQVQLTKTG